eukprot:jgi/Bigna1/129732/aug1.9_g4440
MAYGLVESNEIEALQSEINRLESETGDLNSQIDNLKGDLNRTNKVLEEEIERRKRNESKLMELVREFEESKRKLKEEVERRKQKEEVGWEQKVLEMKMLKELPCLRTGRTDLGVTFGDGKLFAVGGRCNGHPLKSGEYLDLKDLSAGWKELPGMRVERCEFGLAFGDDKLYAVGGEDGSDSKSGEYLDLKDLSAGWKELPDMRLERCEFGLAFGDGKLYAVGGEDGLDSKSGEHLDLKDLSAGWKELPDMRAVRRCLGVAFGDGKLFAVGGRNNDEWDYETESDPSTLGSGEYLDLKDLSAGWKELPLMMVRRVSFGMAFGDGKLFVVGGFDSYDYPTQCGIESGEFLNLKHLEAGWDVLPGLRALRTGFGVAFGDRKLFVVGGELGENSKLNDCHHGSVECLRVAM